VPADHQVLVRVRAASVNPYDWHLMTGLPYVVRLVGSGIGAPKSPRLGVDFAGTVEEVGRQVTRFKPGDEVLGGANGAFAEYLTVFDGGAIIAKPTNLTFEQSAAVPIAALTALQALRDAGHVQPGQRVLINGASGGVGTFAVQIAKALGAKVTGVCSTRNLAAATAIGADHVIDYTREDFTRGSARYDLILDIAGNHPLLDYRRVLAPGGSFVIVGGPSDGRWLGPLMPMLKAMALSPLVHEKFTAMFAQLKSEDLAVVADLMQRGKVTPVIDRQYKLSETPDAVRYQQAGHARGKVIITLE